MPVRSKLMRALPLLSFIRQTFLCCGHFRVPLSAECQMCLMSVKTAPLFVSNRSRWKRTGMSHSFGWCLSRLCQALRPQHAAASVENGLATEVGTEQKEENTPQTPQQTSPPSLACRSLEKCNSCTNSISPMNEPATLERVRNQQSHRKVEKETRCQNSCNLRRASKQGCRPLYNL